MSRTTNRSMMGLVIALLASCTLAGAAQAAESEAMQRERALNRILVGERMEREREAARHGSGLAGIKPSARPEDVAAKKPPMQAQGPRAPRHGKKKPR